MKPILYGYIRVSAKDQNEDRQFIALQRAGIATRFLSIKNPAKISNARHTAHC